MRISIYIMCLLSLAASAQSLFSITDQQHAEKALNALAMTPEDVKFTKDHGEPRWVLSWVTNALNNPYMLPQKADFILMTMAPDEDPYTSHLGLVRQLLECGWKKAPPGIPSFEGFQLNLPDALGEGLLALESDISQSLKLGSVGALGVFTNIPFQEREYLAASDLSSVFNTELNEASRTVLINAGISREAQMRVEQESDLLDGTETAKAWLEVLNTIDEEALLTMYTSYGYVVQGLRKKLQDVSEWPNQVIRIETPAGIVLVGTKGDDVYDEPATLIIDPGGNDVYRNGAGSSNGLEDRWASTIIDLGGNDRYLSDGLLAPGSALFGISVLIDASGDDLYESDYIGTAAAIYGAAWVEDFSGNDIYRAQAICQGAGITGFGTLVDHEGNDYYQAGLYGQGFAGVKGWGMLLDRAGNDVYIAGNVRRDSDRNEDRYLSLSQGFSIGARPHAGGGVAALVDLEGNDTYTADVYGQGVSYYYSAGFLIDAAGNDRYSMYQYGQGCGIHFSLGLLADCGGNDMYSGFILAQGAAHDYSVGMLFDHAGNDTYTADHHAQGRALNNAFAMLVDREGDDAYFGRQRDGTQGIGNEGGFRDYGSLALLLDLNGHDIYSGGFSNRMITLRPLYGTVYDFEEETPDEK